MAVKKSRTGKKKRPVYGPQGTKIAEVHEPTNEQKQEFKKARRANFGAIALLFVAMILLFISPNMTDSNPYMMSVMNLIAYAITVVSGALIYSTTKAIAPDRSRVTKITSGVLIVIGIAGMFMTATTLMS